MSFRDKSILLLISIFFLLPLISCGNKKVEAVSDNDDVLITVNDSSLRISDVERLIPSGLTGEDSVALFNRIVEQWVLDRALSDYAEKNISDMASIDRMVEEYRNSLIVARYLQRMTENASKDVPDERIKAFYEAHRDSMKLEQPLVKGVFLKVADNDESLPNLRKWMTSFNNEALDNIEKSGLRKALQYKYFNDAWVEWSAIAEQIPYRFSDADTFLKGNKNFETDHDGAVYMLHISDYVPTGSEMPYEFAALRIAEIIRSTEMSNYRDRLIRDILKRQMEEGIVKPGIYNPVAEGI